MAIITKNEIAELEKVHDANCISIFIPTHRFGQDVLHKKDAIYLKDQLKDVERKLVRDGLQKIQIDKLLKPAYNLIEDLIFWKHQSDGLALFIADGFFQKYSLPIYFEAYNYVSNEFYLKPLMPMFAGDGRFFILAIELHDAKLYECTRHSITDIVIEDLIPTRLEEAVGYDYEQKSLQFRSQQEGHGEATFHGHGEGNEDRQDEIMRYLHDIDKGIMKLLHDEKAPMIVASLGFLYPMYKKANAYKHLMDDHIDKSPSDMDKILLHEVAWNIVDPYFDQLRKDKIALYEQFHDTEKTSFDIEEVVPAAVGGRVDTLFLRNRADIFGIYDPDKGDVRVDNKQESQNVSLMNLIAIRTLMQGGNVYLMEEHEMPQSFSKVNALYRY